MSDQGKLTNSEVSPLTVQAVNNRVREKLSVWPGLWVEGELIKVKEYPFGIYATLKDPNADAALDIFVNSRNLPTTGEKLKDADRVVIHGRYDLKANNGKLQFTVEIIKKVGLGDLYAQIEELRQKLRAEGVIDETKRQPLPFLPNRIGLITGKDSDAEKDVKQNVLLRWPDAQFETIHVIVQGASSPGQVISAIKTLDDNPEVDVIIIARGGGAFLELVGFSDEGVVRAAAAAKTPIVSAIGHEADRPILDDVADLRASTPTDAAKRVVPDVTEERQRISDALNRMSNRILGFLQTENLHLSQIVSRPALANPFSFIEQKQNDLAQVFNDIFGSVKVYLDQESSVLAGKAGVLRSLSPQGTLDRGYAVVRDTAGHVLTDPAKVKPGTKLSVRLAAGELEATSN